MGIEYKTIAHLHCC